MRTSKSLFCSQFSLVMPSIETIFCRSARGFLSNKTLSILYGSKITRSKRCYPGIPDCDSLNHFESQFCTLALLPLTETACDIRGSKLSMFTNRNMAATSDSSSPPSNSRHKPEINGDCSASKPKPKFSKEELKARLSPIQYQVTQLKATERPGTGEYNKFNERGTYHCIVCDEELFKSDTKFESGCGWPAFFDSIDKSKLKFVQDFSLVGASNLLLLAKKADLVRTEVLCNNCDAHLGHRFDDGPVSKGGIRYCINSAALKFVQPPEAENPT